MLHFLPGKDGKFIESLVEKENESLQIFLLERTL
jgi:hypothetical protein